MELRFHGVRGSVPTPGVEFLKYGGNTSCIELKTDAFQLIFDAGSGFRSLEIDKELPTFFLFSHFHHDHIQGLPFNSNLFDDEVQVHMSSALVKSDQLKLILTSSFSPPFFPMGLLDNINTLNLMNFETLKSAAIDYFDIESFVLNHPGGAVGYKITVGNKKVCIALDHEFGHNQELDSLFQIAAKNADAVVWDGMFTELELPEKKGWGHSSVEQGIRFAEDTGIKSLFITHHAPLRTDLDLDLISKEIHTSGIKLARESENNFI